MKSTLFKSPNAEKEIKEMVLNERQLRAVLHVVRKEVLKMQYN
jgi:hypothetical protein